MSKEQKKEMVDKFARTASEILGLPVQSIVTIIREVEAENVGVGDNLLCDIPH